MKREQIGAMNLHYLYYPFDYFLDVQQSLNMKSIELWGGAPHFLMDDESFDNCAALRKRIEDRGMKVSVFTPECTTYQYYTAAWDPYALEKGRKYYKLGLKAARELGASVLLTNCCGGARDEDPRRTFDRAVETFRQLAPVAADNGVTLAVETVRPEESLIVTRIDQLKNLLDAVGHPALKPAADTVAINVAGESLEQWFDAFGSDIANIHFVDGRPYGHLVWGDGLFPLADYVQLIKDRGYTGNLGQQITDFGYFDEPAEADKKNMARLSQFLDD